MKRTKRIQRMKRKSLLLVAGILLLLTVAIGGTIAYIVTNTDSMVNTFEPGKVPIEINEAFNGTMKSDVTIKNKGNVPAYIRAKVVVTWKDKAGNVSATPVTASDYSISYNETDWTNVDGFWYYKNAVNPEASTQALIYGCSKTEAANPPEGYDLSVEIIAESIQAEGMRANDVYAAFARAKEGS